MMTERTYLEHTFVTRRYIVRVVSTDLNTTVKWETANGQTTGSQIVTRGEFVQIRNPLATQPMLVTCDKPCLVMLYNTGSIISILPDHQ